MFMIRTKRAAGTPFSTRTSLNTLSAGAFSRPAILSSTAFIRLSRSATNESTGAPTAGLAVAVGGFTEGGAPFARAGGDAGGVEAAGLAPAAFTADHVRAAGAGGAPSPAQRTELATERRAYTRAAAPLARKTIGPPRLAVEVRRCLRGTGLERGSSAGSEANTSRMWWMGGRV